MSAPMLHPAHDPEQEPGAKRYVLKDRQGLYLQGSAWYDCQRCAARFSADEAHMIAHTFSDVHQTHRPIRVLRIVARAVRS